MNKRVLIVLLAATVFAAAAFGQSGERPPRPFSDAVADRTAWVITVRKPWEMRAEGKRREKTQEEKDYEAKFAAQEIKRVEASYAAGVRKEARVFADGSQSVEYLSGNRVLFESPTTGKPVMEHADSGFGGAPRRADRLEGFDWLSDKTCAGLAKFNGRACYVYRKIAGGSLPENSDETKAPPVVLATAYVDPSTMKPVALVTLHETRLYTMDIPFRPFALPGPLGALLRQETAVEAKRRQRYQVPQ